MTLRNLLIWLTMEKTSVGGLIVTISNINNFKRNKENYDLKKIAKEIGVSQSTFFNNVSNREAEKWSMELVMKLSIKGYI